MTGNPMCDERISLWIIFHVLFTNMVTKILVKSTMIIFC